MKFVVDLSLFHTKCMLLGSKERIFEALLKENRIKFSKYYTSVNDRSLHLKTGKSLNRENKTVIYEFSCDDKIYDFIVYLFKKKLQELDCLNKSLQQ